MAVRVGTTAHDISGLRAPSTEHYSWSGATIESISPETLRPGGTATLTVDDSSAVALVTFAGVSQTFTVATITVDDSAEVALVTFAGISQTFTRPTATTVSFTVPDGYLYGDRPLRAEDSGGAGRTVEHPYEPVFGNAYVTLASYPPGANVYGTQMLHLGEGYDPQPVNGAQIEIENVEQATNDLELYASGTYSVLVDSNFQRRVIYSDGSASAWGEVVVQEIPDVIDVVVSGPIASVSLGAPTGRASVGDTIGGAVPGMLLTAPTGGVSFQYNVDLVVSVPNISFSTVAGKDTTVVQWVKVVETDDYMVWRRI